MKNNRKNDGFESGELMQSRAEDRKNKRRSRNEEEDKELFNLRVITESRYK